MNSLTTAEEDNTGFGTFKGTFVPNITMMFGVILFLRLGFIVSYAGPWQFVAIIALSLLVMLITSLSIIPIVTNMDIGKGGVYYLISRSFGIEAGAAIGFALYFSQLISIVLCVSGFAYTIHNFIPFFSIVFLEVVTLALLALLSVFSANLALRIQIGIFAILLISVGAVFFGTQDIPSTPNDLELFYPKGLGFWQAFALFYPALTGIEAGMALSGCLKNPSRALSIGNITSLIFSAATYFTLGMFLLNKFPTELLKSSPFVIIDNSIMPFVIYLGICSATLSSALGCLLGAPRMLQSIAYDGALPSWISKTYGKHSEPRIAIVITFGLAFLLLLTTGIDQILPILSMICLLSYGSLNLLAGLNERIHSPNWRPAIHIPWFISIFGAILCISLMLMISPGWAMAAVVFLASIYLITKFREIEANFHDLRSSFFFFFSRHAIYHLQGLEEHPVTWHPQLLTFVGSPVHHEKMLHFANSLTKRSGILSLATVLPEFKESEEEIESVRYTLESYLNRNNLTGIIQVNTAQDIYDGMEELIKLYGLGPIQPNTILLGLTNQRPLQDNFTNLLKTASFYGKNIMFFRDHPQVPLKLFKTLAYRKKKRVDIWWDNNNREHFDLILSYVNTFIHSARWHGARVCLQCVTHSRSAQENLTGYFREYQDSARLKLDFFVHYEEEGYSHYPFIDRYSANADLVFVNLPVEKKNIETTKAMDIQEAVDAVTLPIPTIFVASFDDIDHREGYYVKN